MPRPSPSPRGQRSASDDDSRWMRSFLLSPRPRILAFAAALAFVFPSLGLLWTSAPTGALHSLWGTDVAQWDPLDLVPSPTVWASDESAARPLATSGSLPTADAPDPDDGQELDDDGDLPPDLDSYQKDPPGEYALLTSLATSDVFVR